MPAAETSGCMGGARLAITTFVAKDRAAPSTASWAMKSPATRPPSAAGPISTITPANPIANPNAVRRVIRSSVKTWASATVINGMNARRMPATAEGMNC